MAAPRVNRRDLVEVGSIVNKHGVRGEMRLLPHNPETSSMRPGIEITLARGNVRRPAKVIAARRHKRFVLLRLDGVSSADQAAELVGWTVCLPVSSLPPPLPGEVYHFQLQGLTVITTAGEEIGTVAAVLSTRANDVCVVNYRDREVLIPLITDAIEAIDLPAGRLVIKPLPGLLDG